MITTLALAASLSLPPGCEWTRPTITERVIRKPAHPSLPASAPKRHRAHKPTPPPLPPTYTCPTPPASTVERLATSPECAPPPGITGPWPCTMTPAELVVLEDRERQRKKVNQVPEPSTFLLFCIAFGYARWKKVI